MEPADSFHDAVITRSTITSLLARRSWRRMSSLDDWPATAIRVTAITSAGQFAVAEVAGRYTADALGVDVAIDPAMFAGVASDGRPLQSLLAGAAVHAREYPPESQLLAGEAWLGVLSKTMVADAARAAQGVVIAATPGAGYVRQVRAPCCQRCAVLAGKFYRWNDGFKRHPSCVCVHVPTMGGKKPPGYMDALSPDDVRDLTLAQRQAIAEGADMNQVINATRGRSVRSLSTSEGMGRRGTARAVRGERPTRLTPEGIFRLASDREEARRMLVDHGYILPNGPLNAGQRDGFGQMGRGGTRVGARQAVEEARRTGTRSGHRATMTAAERRVEDARSNLDAARRGRNPYKSRDPITPEVLDRAEREYAHWFAKSGQIYT